MLYHGQRRDAAIVSVFVLALVSPAAALAQEVPVAEPAPQEGSVDEPADVDLHDRRVDYQGRIVVTAAGLRQLDLLAGTSVIEGAELQRNLDGQLGEVLAGEAGVSASGFAPGASRPILRGFSGERVKVLVDGIGAIDASNTSDDHAVSIDPLTAESIEVLRGPAVLLYGSQAIGGAVNVIDKRIPRRMPADGAAHFDLLAGADTASDMREIGASADVPLADGLVGHVDGAWRKTDDLEIPGYAVSPLLRADLLADAAQEEAEGHPDEPAELREAAGARGILSNSASETWSTNAGVALFRGDSNMGVSFGIYDTFYGVPARPGAGHAHGEEEDEAGGEEEHGGEDVRIGLRQYRADFRGDIDLGAGLFDRLNLRAGYSDYTHTEFEGDEIGTVFDVSGIEARMQLVQNPLGALRGSVGAQYYARDFDAVGAEAFIAPNRTEQIALFALQEYGNGPIQIEGSLRFEDTAVDAPSLGLERQFTIWSFAGGLAWEGRRTFRAGVNLSRVARAPAAEELFSNGPHIATQAFEIGNPDLVAERSWGAEAYARGRLGDTEFSVAAFRNWFDDYIYLARTGGEADGLPVFAFRQQDATYTGFEAALTHGLHDDGALRIETDLKAEYVRARLADGSNVPRIPPLGLSAALSAETRQFDLRGEIEWYDAQNRTAAFETPTDGYALVNASLVFRPWEGNDAVRLMLKADNLFDVTARRATSFTKDYIPLAGRNVTISLRASI